MPDNTQRSLDLAKLAREVAAGQGSGFSRSDLAVLGGRRRAETLLEFLNSCDFPNDGGVWWLCRWAHRVQFFHGSRPEDLEIEVLERLRVFGPRGDLDLRREGDEFLWRFVGSHEAAPPVSTADSNYWDGPGSPDRLSTFERSALLWGALEKKLGRFKEDRVGWADLNYPEAATETEGATMQVCYTEYLNGGNVELVRFRRLETGPPRPRGEEEKDA